MSSSRSLIFLVTLLTINIVYGQRTISAKITEAGTGMPVSGANVLLGNASAGAVTNDKGYFSMKINGAEIRTYLIISHVGYQTKKIPVEKLGTEVQLCEQIYEIGEVIIKYITLRKLLIKKWKMDEKSIDIYVKLSLEILHDKDSIRYDEYIKNYRYISHLKASAESLRLVFYPNEKAKVTTFLSYNNLRWYIDEQSRKIVIYGDGPERRRTIVELTEDHLILRRISKNNITYEISYVPVN